MHYGTINGKFIYEVIHMYSGTNKLASFSIILSVINIFCILPIIGYLKNLKGFDWAFFFAAAIALVCSSLALIITACALRGAAQNLNFNDETYMNKITELKKRVEELENKVNM